MSWSSNHESSTTEKGVQYFLFCINEIIFSHLMIFITIIRRIAVVVVYFTFV